MNTFRGKYGYLPGDIPDPDASNFGFSARSGTGRGDGNGVLEGWNGAFTAPDVIFSAEYFLFWRDLSTALLIDGSFTQACAGCISALTTTTLAPQYMPPAIIGNGNFIYVYEGFPVCCPAVGNGTNYFSLAVITGSSTMKGSPGLSVKQAFAIDGKIDDGLPQGGKTLASYATADLNGSNPNHAPVWAAGGAVEGTANTSAKSASSTTCYDNSGVVGTQKYSITQNNGSGMNCSLLLKFQ